MAIKTLQLQPKWFSDATPKNPKTATATLTFTGVVADAQTVIIGTETYEFKASGDAETGKIKVDVSKGVTAEDAVEALATTINATSALVDAVAISDEEQDIVVLNYKAVGTEGNAIEISTTATNASFGASVTKLSGGQLGIPCPIRDVVVFATPYYYWCDKEGSDHTVSWKRFTPASY